MTELLLGVDAGGTKTHAVIATLAGTILGVGVAGTGNWERVGWPAASQEVMVAVDSALSQANRTRADISSATFALAGIDWDSDAIAMQKLLGSYQLGGRITVMNDGFALLFAGTTDGIGCASIAGTGGKTVGRDGNSERATLGMATGEGGGAGQIVNEGSRILAEMHHGQRPTTALLAEILTATGFSTAPAMFQAMARDGFSIDEALAPLFFASAAAGDPAAGEIIELVARQHARDVIGIVSQLKFDSDLVQLVRAGGLHTANSPIFDHAFNSEVAKSKYQFKSEILAVAPVIGAVVHAATAMHKSFGVAERERLFHDASLRADDFRNGNSH